MSRDYAKRNRPKAKPRPSSNVPAWVWLFTGSVLGAFVMFLVYLRGVPPAPTTAESPAATAKSAEPDKKSDEPTIPKPRFVFYELLKESEVVVDTTPVDSPTANTPIENVEYILQAGSFRNVADADRLRAQLILVNLDARVEKKLVGDQTWHRVMVGPFKTRAMASKARGTLASMDVDSIMRKQPTGG